RFDGTGARLAVLCETEVLVVDVASQQVMARLANPHKEALTAFDLPPDGQRLAPAGHDGGITVRDVATDTPVRNFLVRLSRRPYPPPRGMEPPEVWGVAVALSGDGSRVAVVTIEGTVYVWDVGTGKLLFDHADKEAGGAAPRARCGSGAVAPRSRRRAIASACATSTCRAGRRASSSRRRRPMRPWPSPTTARPSRQSLRRWMDEG